MHVRALRGGAVQSSEHCHMFLLIMGALESNRADKTEQLMAFCGC